MQIRFPKIFIAVHGAAVIGFAAMVLILPLKWVAAWMVSSLLHELFHIIAARLMGVEVRSVEIGISGAKIETEPIEGLQELVCIGAGPLGGCVLMLFGSIFPRLAVCAFVQTIWNVLPVFPLDGGRLLRSLARIIAKPWADRLCRGTEYAFLGGLLLGGVYAAIWMGLGWIPFLLAVAMFLRLIHEKYLANGGKNGYNSSTLYSEVRV